MWVWSTWEACKQLDRQFIGIELEKKYFEATKIRLNIESDIKPNNFIIKKIDYIRSITISSLK